MSPSFLTSQSLLVTSARNLRRTSDERPVSTATGEALRRRCNLAVVFPSDASLSSAVSSCVGAREHRTRDGNHVFTYEHSERVRVCMTAGYWKGLEAELATFCSNDASVVIPFPALFAEVFGLKRGSAHRLDICRYTTTTTARNLSLPPNVANLVAGLFQSAAPASVRAVLSSSTPSYSVLFPSSFVNKPVSVDGIASFLTPPLFFARFRHFSVYFVAVCTGTAEKVAQATTMLDVNHHSVCDHLRVAVMEITRKLEQFESVEKAIHETADISVPESLLCSTGNGEQKRMLSIPRSTAALEKNQRIVREFFLEHIVCLGSAREIERLSIELVGEPTLCSAKQCIEAPICHRELVYQVYLLWKAKMGTDIDFVPLIDVFEKLGLRELKDRCKMFVQEHSFRFTLHHLNCNCFVEE